MIIANRNTYMTFSFIAGTKIGRHVFRISMSSLKGGKLAKLAFPAQVVALILSDIVDDPIELVTTNALLES
jgi:glycerate-2-kinase